MNNATSEQAILTKKRKENFIHIPRIKPKAKTSKIFEVSFDINPLLLLNSNIIQIKNIIV
jgi:hypothetical protein